MGSTGIAIAYERVAMLNIGPHNAAGGYDASAINFVIMGPGFKSIDEALNPSIDEVTYVNDESATKTVTGYAPNWDFDGDVIKDDDVVAFIRNIGKTQATGADAEAQIVMFDMWDVDPADFTVDAEMYTVAVQVDSGASITGGEKLGFKGSLLGKGDVVAGTYNTSTDTFTASV